MWTLIETEKLKTHKFLKVYSSGTEVQIWTRKASINLFIFFSLLHESLKLYHTQTQLLTCNLWRSRKPDESLKIFTSPAANFSLKGAAYGRP